MVSGKRSAKGRPPSNPELKKKSILTKERKYINIKKLYF
jgi:hypothetical protein